MFLACFHKNAPYNWQIRHFDALKCAIYIQKNSFFNEKCFLFQKHFTVQEFLETYKNELLSKKKQKYFTNNIKSTSTLLYPTQKQQMTLNTSQRNNILLFF